MLLRVPESSTLTKLGHGEKAVARGDVSADTGGEFPRYIWTRVEGRVYEARLSNASLGQYKGYPIQDFEAPGWLE